MQGAPYESECMLLFTISIEDVMIIFAVDLTLFSAGSPATVIHDDTKQIRDPHMLHPSQGSDIRPLMATDLKANSNLSATGATFGSETLRQAKPHANLPSATRHVQVLPALPLLRYVAESAMSAQRRLLKLVLLPPKLLDDAIRNDPDSVAMLGFPLGTKVASADLVDRIKHLQYTALQALLAAYRYGETRVDVKDKVILGLEIGRLALDMLGTLQGEMVREDKISAKRKRPVDENGTDRVGKARKTSIAPGNGSLHNTPQSTPTQPRHKPVKPSPLRRTSSTRDDFAAAGAIDTSESEADLLILQRNNARKQEGSRLLKETEDILSSAVSKTTWFICLHADSTDSLNSVQSRCPRIRRGDHCYWSWL